MKITGIIKWIWVIIKGCLSYLLSKFLDLSTPSVSENVWKSCVFPHLNRPLVHATFLNNFRDNRFSFVAHVIIACTNLSYRLRTYPHPSNQVNLSSTLPPKKGLPEHVTNLTSVPWGLIFWGHSSKNLADIMMSTETRFILCTWFGEISSCSCLTVLPGSCLTRSAKNTSHLCSNSILNNYPQVTKLI